MSLFKGENPTLGTSATANDPVAGDVKIQTVETLTYSQSVAGSGATSQWLLTHAPYAMQIVAIRENHAVAGAASLTAKVRKITADAVLPNASAGATCIEVQSAAFTLDSTANTKQTATLVAGAAIQLAVGDRLGIAYSSATQTGLVGHVIQVDVVRI